jgi:cytochrome d ubiquinol oxidase subunit II
MPALYLPVIVMLLALVLRGVAFEFRWIAKTPGLWNLAFSTGSTLAAFSQGIILGGLIQGIAMTNGEFSGGSFDWATPFALLCGIGTVAGYALLGATWLAMKTENELAEHSRKQAHVLLYAVIALMGAVSLATPFVDPRIAQRWFSWPNIAYLSPVPLITAAVALYAWRWIDKKHDVRPFGAVIVLFLLGYAGLVISVFPYLAPPSLTIWQASAAPESQIFMLIGTLVMLPIILGYVVFVYWLFRGKVGDSGMYHH